MLQGLQERTEASERDEECDGREDLPASCICQVVIEETLRPNATGVGNTRQHHSCAVANTLDHWNAMHEMSEACMHLRDDESGPNRSNATEVPPSYRHVWILCNVMDSNYR